VEREPAEAMEPMFNIVGHKRALRAG
jgi:hypothetical protein